MKVLHVSPSYYPAFKFGGPIQSVHLLNKTLVRQGVTLDVITTNAGLEDRKDIVLNRWLELDQLRVKYLTYYGYVHYNFSPQLLLQLLSEARHYDLLHITAVWNFPVWAAAFAASFHNIPYVISPRGTIYPETINMKSAGLKKWYYRLLAGRCLKKAAAIHYTSEDERDKVNAHLGLTNKSLVIANGIEFPQQQQLPAFCSFFPELKDKRYLLFLGRINKKKGLDLLAPAFVQIAARYPELRLVIAGPDNEGYAAQIKAIFEAAQLQSRVLFTGELLGEKKYSAYRDASAFVLSSYSENFGMAVAEAMSFGTPVLISDQVGIATEVQRAGAGLVSTLDTAQIAAAMCQLLDHPAAARELGQKGKQLVQQRYAIEQVAAQMKQQYQVLIDQHASL